MNADQHIILGHLHQLASGEPLGQEGEAALSAWVAESPYHAALVAKVKDEEGFSAAVFERLREGEEKEEAWEAIRVRLHLGNVVPANAEGEKSVRIVHRVHFLRTAWFRYAAAILLLIGSGTLIYLWNTQEKTAEIVSNKPVPAENILPGGNKALLTLADGRTIMLDSAANGELANQQGMRVFKDADGKIRYGADDDRQDGDNNAAIAFNTMSTPKGGQYQLSLPDGSKVWLNAASSITYPVVFAGKTRKVKITGEAYFEIKQNAKQPFIVDINSTSEVTVLGTAFNINAYGDEPVIKTTLINGSVRINNKILQPGQADVNGKIIQTNINQDIAWKNGFFNFNDLDVETAMRQLARWYDVDIQYDGDIPKGEFGGEVGRGLQLSQVLKGLNGIVVRLELKGRTIHVSPL